MAAFVPGEHQWRSQVRMRWARSGGQSGDWAGVRTRWPGLRRSRIAKAQAIALFVPAPAVGQGSATSHSAIRIRQSRLRFDPRTRDYCERRIKEGKTRREIARCLKRYVAREVFHLIRPTSSRPRHRGSVLGAL